MSLLKMGNNEGLNVYWSMSQTWGQKITRKCFTGWLRYRSFTRICVFFQLLKILTLNLGQNFKYWVKIPKNFDSEFPKISTQNSQKLRLKIPKNFDSKFPKNFTQNSQKFWLIISKNFDSKFQNILAHNFQKCWPYIPIFWAYRH